jgi:hypothetical protein
VPEATVATAPLPPLAVPAQVAPLSQAARIVNTFIAPSRTFTDLRRSAAWWAPFLLMIAISTLFVYTAGQKIGFRKIMENQMQAQPKAQARLDNLPADKREAQLDKGARLTGMISYAFPVITLFFWLIIAVALFGTFKFAAGANVSFKISLAIVVYAALPLILKSLLATIAVAAGMSPDSFSFQNPLATNPGYFMSPGDNVFLYSIATGVDIFMIWTLVLTAIGFTCVSKLKRGTSYAVVFGWWAVFTLVGSALGAAFS